MRIWYLVLSLSLAAAVFADTLTLRSGRVVNGTYLGGTPRQIKMEVGDRIESFDIGDVTSLTFAAPAHAAAAAPAAAAPAAASPAPTLDSTPAADNTPRLRRADGNVFRPDSAAPAPAAPAAKVELPSGTNFVVRMIDAVDSETNNVGQTFNASMDEPVIVNGETVIPRGSDVIVKLVDDKESGKLAGRTVLTLDLVSVRVNGRMVDINTQSVSQSSSSRGARTAKMSAGGAALGAIIGAIAGGGKGAAVGAGAGAAAGAGAQIATKGQRVHIPSETRLTFVLDTAVKI